MTTDPCEHTWVSGGDWGPKHGHPWSSQDRYCTRCGLEGMELIGKEEIVLVAKTGDGSPAHWGEPSYIFPESGWKMGRRIPIRDEGDKE